MKKITFLIILLLIFYICLNSARADEEIIYISDLEPTASTYYLLKNNVDTEKNNLTLLKESEEVVYEKGIMIVPNSNSYASIYFTDIQEYGYKSFETDIGINVNARNKNAKVEFKIYADGKLVFSSGEFASSQESQHVKVSLEDVEVLQLVVDSLGTNSYDYAVWGNAFFIGNKDTPYLAVDDLEFNLKEQITSSNILEYVVAKDTNGNDIKDKVTYETNYNGEEKGTFKVTYTVKDENNNINSRTVDMILTGENYAKELSLERLKQPWASYLYHGRGTLSTQGKKAWDLVLKEILNFDKSKWQLINRWGEDVYLVDIDLQANGIYAQTDELSSLGFMLMDDEPRTFILKDWNCELTKKDGLVSHIKFWVSKQSLNQDEWLKKIETNTILMLSAIKDDMTEAQRLNMVSEKYKNWLKYGNGGQLLTDSLGNGIAVCGGNARGYIYLSERLGIKSVWGRSGSHAWSFTKISDYDYWFKTDLLSGEFLSPGINGEGNLTVDGNYKIRHYKWFTFGTLEYPRKLLRYPSVWVELSSKKIVLTKNKEYDLTSYILDYGSIYNDNYSKDDIKIIIDKLDENGNVIKENINSFALQGDGFNLKAGNYQVHYIISDNGKTNSTTMRVRVTTGEEININLDNVIVNGNVNNNKLGLWTGKEEKWYVNGIHIYEEGSITFDVENYRYLSFDFGIKNSVRENIQWGSNGKVAVKVVITTSSDEFIYEGSILGWKTKYESIFLELPKDAKKVTIFSIPKGTGNNHAGIGNLKVTKDDNSNEIIKEENPPKISKNEMTIISNQVIDFTKELVGVDDEDGEFELNNSNFKIESLPTMNNRYIPGIYNLNYEIKDSDGNVQKGVIKVTIEAASYIVTFYYNDGIQKIKVKENELITAPKVSKSGYNLIGWLNKNEKFDFSTPINEDITLVAQWKKIQTQVDNKLDNEVENKPNLDSDISKPNLNEDISNSEENNVVKDDILHLEDDNNKEELIFGNNYKEFLNILAIIICLFLIVVVSYKKKKNN